MSSYVLRHRSAAIASADERLLAELGYKQEFQREFTPFETFGLSFSVIGLFPSILVLFSSIFFGGPAVIVWGWVVATSFLVIVGLSVAELASAAPTSGGPYFWTHTYASPKCRNLLAWIVGYANTIGCITTFAINDWTAATVVMAAASIATDGSFTPTISKIFGVFVAFVLIHAAVCSLGTMILARLQNVSIALNVLLCLVVIVALPAATPKELKNSASYALGSFTPVFEVNVWPSAFTFILSFAMTFWAMASFDSSVHISEEASNAAVAVPWAIVLSTFITGILGFAVNVSLTFCMGQDLEALLVSNLGLPLVQVFFNSFGKKGTLAVWSLIILAEFMTGLSMMLVASRQSFAFARDGALPFSRQLYRMNVFTKTPVNVVLFCAASSIGLGALVFASPIAINVVLYMAITGQSIAYLIPIAARWIWRKENGWIPRAFSLGGWSGVCAITSVVWMMFTLLVSLFPNSKQTNPQQMNYMVVVLGGVLMFPLVWYYFPIYGGVHWFEGPVPNVDGYVARKWMTPQNIEGVVAESVLPTEKAQERTRSAPRSTSRDFSGDS